MLLIYLRGMLMGIADLVPGVSGGTIAIITGIYERLIGAISNVGPHLLPVLFQDGIKAFWKSVDGTFLVAVFAGILSSIFLFAEMLHWLMHHHPVLFWSVFSGFIIASVFQLGRSISWGLPSMLMFVLGIMLVTGSFVIQGDVVDPSYRHFFLAALLAISAMILPGISGSLLLISVGMYEPVLEAVTNREVLKLLTFGGGCIVGLMIMSRLIKWALSNFHDAVMALLIGLMAGSLLRMWPWQSSNPNIGPFERLLMPLDWAHQHGQPAQLIEAFLLALAAGAAVIFMEAKVKQLSEANSSPRD